MHIEIIRAKSTVGYQQAFEAGRILPLAQQAYGLVFVLEPSRLYFGINILVGPQVVQCHHMDTKIFVWAAHEAVVIPIRIKRKPCAVAGQQLEAFKRLAFKLAVEAVKHRRKCI